jgi:hypothetical protein
MRILFIHQNFPGQYLHLARHMGADPAHQVVFITQREDAALPGVKKIVYKPARTVTKDLHHYLGDTEAAVLNAQAVARVALDLKQSGFIAYSHAPRHPFSSQSSHPFSSQSSHPFSSQNSRVFVFQSSHP